jgi:hypothetical protein
MDPQGRDAYLPHPVWPGTRDCDASDCGAQQGMLLRDVVQTDEDIRLVYVCEHCGAGVNVAQRPPIRRGGV